MQLWSDAESGSRVDADAYQELGVSAVWWFLILYSLGVMEVLFQRPPTYPVAALRQGVQGEVVLQVRFSKDGFVHSARAIRGEPILNQEAVRQWRLNPYRTNDKPSDMAAQNHIQFQPHKVETI